MVLESIKFVSFGQIFQFLNQMERIKRAQIAHNFPERAPTFRSFHEKGVRSSVAPEKRSGLQERAPCAHRSLKP